MIKFDEEIFSKHKEEFVKISLDSSKNVSMTSSTKKAVNFDDVKTEYLNSNGYSNENLKSCDALLSQNSYNALIEFKNGEFAIKDIRIKIADSMLILGDIKQINIISVAKKEIEFILVYNEVINANRVSQAQKEIHNHLESLAKTEYIYFDLERYKGVYFKNVHTYTPTQFDAHIAKV